MQFKEPYKLSIGLPSDQGGYKILLSTDVSVFDFANILAEYFKIDVDIDSDNEDDQM